MFPPQSNAHEWARRILSRGFKPALCLAMLPTTAHAGDTGEAWEQEGAPEAEAVSEPASPESRVPEAASRGTGHQGQFGLRVGIAGGYRMMFRYAESPFCGPPSADEGESCFYGAPLATDLALSFAPFDSLEVFAWSRLGLGRDTQTDTDALRALGGGVRIYTMSQAPLKIFFQPAVAFSFEGGGQDPRWQARSGAQADYRSDILLQLLVGPQYDFHPNFGAYAGAGMTAGVLRAMSANLEVAFGLEARYP